MKGQNIMKAVFDAKSNKKDYFNITTITECFSMLQLKS